VASQNLATARYLRSVRIANCIVFVSRVFPTDSAEGPQRKSLHRKRRSLRGFQRTGTTSGSCRTGKEMHGRVVTARHGGG
jgi:hypothetical protein